MVRMDNLVLLIRFVVKSDDSYRLEGKNLHAIVDVDLYKALTQKHFVYTHVDAKKYLVETDAPLDPNKKVHVPRLGVDGEGDLVVTLRIVMSKTIFPEDHGLLKRCLGHTDKEPNGTHDILKGTVP